MPTPYNDMFNPSWTPQDEAMPNRDMVENNAGGQVFEADDWVKLDRFLILGSESPSYYASARTLTRDSAKNVMNLIQVDGVRVVDRVVEISKSGRAYKNDSALFVLALAFSQGDDTTRRLVAEVLPRVARTGTHLFTFVDYMNSMRGWGKTARRAVSNWYESKDLKALAYQITKYQQRNGWSHGDLLRKAHPETDDPRRDALYRYVTQGEMYSAGMVIPDVVRPESVYIDAVEAVKNETDPKRIAELVRDHNLPREVLPTDALNSQEVWEAMLDAGMPITAMIRNLATMTSKGVLVEMNSNVQKVVETINDDEIIRKGRVHPLQFLSAFMTYKRGHGVRGNQTWTPVRSVLDALDKGFYKAFGAIEPINKRVINALDVSGSMEWGEIGGIPALTPRDVSAVMSLVTANVEPMYRTIAFSPKSGRMGFIGRRYGNQNLNDYIDESIIDLAISPRQRIDGVIKEISNLPFCGTDCALPMLWAVRNKVEADVFVIYTDSETWAGEVHPSEAIQYYRQKMDVPDAKVVVVGMIANNFTIADPDDKGMLDVVGMDTNAPSVISEFSKGRV